MTFPLKLAAAGSAIALAAACAIPLGAGTGAAGGPGGPVTCALRLTESGGSVTVAAVVEARDGVTGSYALKLRQSGAGGRSEITQGGDFTLAAGESATLSEARLSGRAADLGGTFTLQIGGKTFVCPITP